MTEPSPPYRGFTASHFDARLQQLAREVAADATRRFEALLGEQAVQCAAPLAIETSASGGIRTWRVMLNLDLVFDPFLFAKEKR